MGTRSRARPVLLDLLAKRCVGQPSPTGELDLCAVYAALSLGVGVQLRLAPPPVVIGRPMPRERLNEGELHALQGEPFTRMDYSTRRARHELHDGIGRHVGAVSGGRLVSGVRLRSSSSKAFTQNPERGSE